MDREEVAFSRRDEIRRKRINFPHQGKDTVGNIGVINREGQIRNAKVEAEKKANERELENISIKEVIRKVLKKGIDKQGKDSLEVYLRWLIVAIDKFSMGNEVDYPPETVIKKAKSSGSGGQNVNKRNTAVSVHSNLIGVHIVKVSEERTQAQNLKLARDRMDFLINKHVGAWLETMAGDSSMQWELKLKQIVVNNYLELEKDNKIGKGRRAEIENICDRVLKIEKTPPQI